MKRMSFLTAGLLCMALLTGVRAQVSEPTLRVTVTDESGNPLPNAMVGVGVYDQRIGRRYRVSEPLWQSVDSKGELSVRWHAERLRAVAEILTGERGGVVFVWVTAPGFVAKQVSLFYPAPNTLTVQLRRGVPIELTLTRVGNLPLPDDFGTRTYLDNLQPVNMYQRRFTPPIAELIVRTPIGGATPYDEQQLGEAPGRWRTPPLEGLFDRFGIERIDAGRYRFTLPPDYRGSLMVQVDRADWLRGYLEPVPESEWRSGRIARALPPAGSLRVQVDVSQLKQADAQSLLAVARIVEVDGQPQWCILETRMLTEPQTELRLENLASGAGWLAQLMVGAGERPLYRDEVVLEQLAPNTQRTLSLRYEPFDPNRYKGKRALTIRVQSHGGRPVASTRYTVQLYLPRYAQSVPIATGRTDSQGRLRLSGLYENPRRATRLGFLDPPHYTLQLEGVEDSRFSFTLYAGDGVQELIFRPAPKVGDLAPDVRLIDLETGKARRLSEFRGRWVLLDFWATWCMPCHESMEKLRSLLTQKRAVWGNRLQVITISIDRNAEAARAMLKSRGWWALGRHFWAGDGEWMAPAAQTFGVNAIPRQILVDPRGRIVWDNHRDFRTSIDQVLERWLGVSR